VILRQIPHDDLGCASYLVGDQRAGVAAVVDPRWEIDAYLRLADYFDVRIAHVLETHIHADHVSGHGRLAAATGATIHLHAASGATFPHEPFEDGWELELGSVRVRALHTAGHRPEHTAFVLCDSARASQPWAVLTGDSLFVGSVARPDLAIEPTDGARQIWASLHERLLALAPETEVWPAHLGGSLCGGAEMDVKTSSTIGFEREHNAWLLEPDVESFTARVLAGLQPQPPNFRAIVEINKGPLLVEGVSVDTLSVNELRSRRDAGALIVDVRSAIAWDGGHIGGSLALPIGHTGFGTRLAWLAPADAEVLLVGDDEAHAREAVALADAVAVRNVGGVLAGGIDAWRAAGGELEAIATIEPAELAAQLRSDRAPQLLDVREQADWARGHVPGSVWRPWHDIDEVPDGLDPQRPIATICAGGPRAGVAASLLARLGVAEPVHVVGGGVETLARYGVVLEAG
jgi:glyoxylase-like metal-dependent hydrolase (beta-lactamase superfamily II)/rhodanese-related sulfurtransferase